MKARASQYFGLSTIVGGLVLASLFSPVAMASKARLKSLSQDVNGSLFVKDERNIFLNPASVHELENMVSFEWGATAAQQTGTVNGSISNPTPEGVGIHKTENLNYALGIGRYSDTAVLMNSTTATAILGTTNYPFLPQTPLDVIVGGKSGEYKWGAGLHYARSTHDVGATANFPKRTARDLSISGGVLTQKWNGYGKLALIGESTTTVSAGSAVKFDGKLGFELGGKYDLDAVSAVGVVVNRGAFGYDTGAATGEYSSMSARADYFRILAAKTGSTLFIVAGLKWLDSKISPNGSPSITYTNYTSPVGFGFDHKALTWLTLRASATQNILIDQTKFSNNSTDYEAINPESTRVAAGFTAHFNDAMTLDATFEGANGNGTAANAGKLNGVVLASDVALTYHY